MIRRSFPICRRYPRKKNAWSQVSLKLTLWRWLKLLIFFSDPLGPLWPVIGIIIEAIVLFLIIFIAEKRKKKREGGKEKIMWKKVYLYHSSFLPSFLPSPPPSPPFLPSPLPASLPLSLPSFLPISFPPSLSSFLPFSHPSSLPPSLPPFLPSFFLRSFLPLSIASFPPSSLHPSLPSFLSSSLPPSFPPPPFLRASPLHSFRSSFISLFSLLTLFSPSLYFCSKFIAVQCILYKFLLFFTVCFSCYLTWLLLTWIYSW